MSHASWRSSVVITSLNNIYIFYPYTIYIFEVQGRSDKREYLYLSIQYIYFIFVYKYILYLSI